MAPISKNPLGLRTPPHRRPRQVRPSRHPRPSYRWWTYLTDLRHPTSHRQVDRRILPKVCRRTLEEPVEAGLGAVRSVTTRRRQPSV